MSTSLQVHFEDGGRPGVIRVSSRVFRVYAIEGEYGLPVLVLQTADGVPRVTLQELSVVEIRNATGASDLSTWLRADWNTNTRPASIVSARVELLSDVLLPAAVIRKDLARQPAGEPLRAEIVWRAAFVDAEGAHTLAASVYLEFAPEGEPIPAVAPETRRESRRLRDISKQVPHTGFAAVDFGTSASTVTVHDDRKMTASAIDPDQAESLREGIVALLTAAPPAEEQEATTAWRRMLGQVVTDVRQKAAGIVEVTDVATIEDLAHRLRAAGSAEQELLDLVCLALENAQPGIPPQLQQWLDPRLHECYDRAFQVPALSQFNLKRVPFGNGADRFQTLSSVRREPGAPRGLVFCDQAAADFPDLKRYLGKAAPTDGMVDEDGRPLTTDDLIARIYYMLVTRSEEFSAYPDEPSDTPVLRPEDVRPLNELIVTYPTTTPPSTRDELAQLVRETLDARSVVVDYDEGVAAGLFFVARDFGGNRSVGMEALRARSRRVPDSDPARWEQNIMVVDIGGGTTDIALLRLTLTDLTPDMPGVKPHVPGRFYLLRPEVLGSTGHPQLGGDYLTLKVFYWLKAAIADALLGHPADTPGWIGLKNLVPRSLHGEGDTVQSLAKSVLRYGVKQEGLAERDVTDALRKIIPTHALTSDGPRLTEAFKLLWNYAEQAKRTLGAGGDFLLRQDDLQEALTVVVPVEKPEILAGLLPAEGIQLHPADFETLASPVFKKMVRLAKPVLYQRSWNHRLDRVMLSGRGSAMPVLRDAVVAELAGLRGLADETLTGTDRSVSWNPAAITVEQRLAKQVTSIGACWAHSMREFVLTSPEDAAKRLAMGRTEIDISVDNLFINLPCDFKLKGLGTDLQDLLLAGTPFEELDESGTLGVRSEWLAIPNRFEVHRPIDEEDGESIQWGQFVLANYAAAESFTPDTLTWLGNIERGIRAKVRASVEMGHDLTPTINLCNGDPHFVVSGRAIELFTEVPDNCVGSDEHGDSQLIRLPWDIVAVGDAGRSGTATEQVVFRKWDGERAEDSMFTEVFHDHQSLESPYILGAIADLPPAPSSGNVPEYAFYAIDGEGRHPLGSLPLPGAWSPRAVYRVSLDRRGRLRIYRGRLPYWQAQSLRDVEQRPGAVRQITLKCDVPFNNPAWEPFSGRH